MGKEVSVCNHRLSELFNMNLSIPGYQRIYCWQDKNVERLLDDIWNLEDGQVYHLGSVIFQKDEINVGADGNPLLNIIDGQQRLVTLSLIYQILNDNGSPLLTQEMKSSEAKQFIAYNKYLIQNYIDKYKLSDIEAAKKIEVFNNSLRLTVLVLESSALDLAYTFFSNQNKQGVPLSNYDLLKSHHLRFISDERWAKHLAQKWDQIIKESDSGKTYKISTTLGLYLFRMRNWLYHNDWNNNNKYKVKEEFEASRYIAEIPPFGENFDYNEAIQGGTHFFAYTDFFMKQCEYFHETKQYKYLQKLDRETHHWFREVMEAILFGYFLKFGTSYLSEALICISRIISKTRFEISRAEQSAVIYAEYNKVLLGLIDRATSPTFFLADCKAIYKRFPSYDYDNYRPIQQRYFNLLKKVHAQIDKKTLTESFKNETIEDDKK